MAMTKAGPTKEYIINAIRKIKMQQNVREFPIRIRNEFRGKGAIVPSKLCWNSNPQSDGIRRWGHWEVIRS